MKNAIKAALLALFVASVVAMPNKNVAAYTSPDRYNDAVYETNIGEYNGNFTDCCAGSISEEAYYSSFNSNVSATAGIKLSALEKSITMSLLKISQMNIKPFGTYLLSFSWPF